MPVSATATKPRRIIPRTLALGLSALVVAGLLTWSPAVTTGWNQGSSEATLWQLLNGARVNNGMAPLQQHSTLISLARWRSSDMLAKNYFSHTIAGCGCLVYAYYDSNGLNYVWAGENIGWNSGLDDSYSPVRVHEKFMASPGHRANVLTAAFTHGGVGAAAADNQMFQGYVQNTRMYTELFLQAAAGAPAPAPAPPAGGGGGGGGGGGSAPPAQTVAQAQADPEPEPEPKLVGVETPQRPVSSAGLDGASVVVAAPARRIDLATRLRIDEIAAERVAALATATPAADQPPAADAGTDLEVRADQPAEDGLIEGIIGAVIGFLFG
ncbi:MAG: CAP domain-containing protein [Candidatus Limnocylindria bacterium]